MTQEDLLEDRYICVECATVSLEALRQVDQVEIADAETVFSMTHATG